MSVNSGDLLFAGGYLPDVLEARRQVAVQAIDDWDPDQLLPTGTVSVG